MADGARQYSDSLYESSMKTTNVSYIGKTSTTCLTRVQLVAGGLQFSFRGESQKAHASYRAGVPQGAQMCAMITQPESYTFYC